MAAQTTTFGCSCPTLPISIQLRSQGKSQHGFTRPESSPLCSQGRPSLNLGSAPRLRKQSRGREPGVIVQATVNQEQKTKDEQEKKAEIPGQSSEQDPDAVTQKYGLEAGLWQVSSTVTVFSLF